MNIRIFLFKENPGKSADRTVRALKSAFADYLPDNNSVMVFPGIKDAAANITEAFRDSHVVMFLTSPERFAETKRKIARTFNIKMEVNEELQAKAFATLKQIIPNASAEEYSHCVSPKNSRVFSLEDGLYNGFSVASGNQTIIFLPYENGRTDLLLSKQVIPYINAAYHTQINLDAFRKFNCERLSDALKSCDTAFALAKTNTSSYFTDYVSGNETIKQRMTDTGRTEKRGNMQPEEYIVNLSIMAKELASAEYGVAMSNAYYSGNDENTEKIIYLAITNDKKTSVREVRSIHGEDVDSFLERVSGDLCTFIADVIETEDENKKVMEKNTGERTKKYKLGIAVVSAAIVLLLTATVVLFTKNGYTFKNWFVDMKNFIFPGQGEIETTIVYVDENESTLPDETDTPDDTTDDDTTDDDTTGDDVTGDESESKFIAG